jgi:hypothetical protein
MEKNIQKALGSELGTSDDRATLDSWAENSYDRIF